MQTNTTKDVYTQTIHELNNLPDEYLEEAYDFIKYLRMKSIREKNWKSTFIESLDTMNEISRKQGITEQDIEKEIKLARKGK